MMRSLVSAIPTLLACLCVTTTVTQLAGIGVLWSKGMLSQDKVARYAAALYGIDPDSIRKGGNGDSNEQRATDQQSRDEQLARRVTEESLIKVRSAALKKETDSIRTLEQNLNSERNRRTRVRQNFAVYLEELDNVAVGEALTQVQMTLEVLQPKQAKNLILRMLADEGLDEDDDVLADIVTIVKAMPQDKLRRILGEFKTDFEREQLHRVLVEIGELEKKAEL